MALGTGATLALLAAGPSGARELTHWDVGRDWPRPLVLTSTRVVGPVLAGDRVVWARGSIYGAWTVEAAPGGVVARLGTGEYELDRWRTWHELALAGSPTRLAFLEQFVASGTKYDPSRVRRGRLAAGTPDAPPRPVLDCRADVALRLPARLALAGDVVVSSGPCGGDDVRAIDLASGASWTAPEGLRPATAEGVVALGDELRDAATGAMRGAYPPLGAERYAVDGAVQADGTQVLEVSGRAYPRTLEVRVPGEGAPRPLPIDRPLAGANGDDVDAAPAVRIAGGRIAVRVRTGRGAQQLAVGGLDGHLTPVVDFGAETAARPAADPQWWSFDGTRIAWASRQCERVTIGVTDVRDVRAAGPPEAVRRKVCAAPRVISKSARVDARGRFSLRVTCGAACRDVLRLDFGGDPIRRAVVRFSFPGSTRPRLVHARLPRGATTRYGVSVRVDGDPDVEALVAQVSLRRGRASR